jgi:hypothetical protein
VPEQGEEDVQRFCHAQTIFPIQFDNAQATRLSASRRLNMEAVAGWYATSITAAIVGLLLTFAGCVRAQELVFLPAEESARILGSEDEFIPRMSPFDRSARLKTDRDVSQAEYLRFAAADARDWDDNEEASIRAAFRKIEPAIARLGLPWPSPIFVIKTSGNEAQYAAYTRGEAVIFPAKVIGTPGKAFQALLAHELFHVFSRANPAIAEALYNAIGFVYCGDLHVPEDLAPRLVTNPDAPRIDYCMEVTVGGRKEWVVPILVSPSARFDPSEGGEYLDYAKLKLLIVERSGNGSTPAASRLNGAPRLVDLDEVSGFFEKTGDNTGYVIHPEEIVADNFAMLVIGEPNVRSPEILRKVREILESRTD